MKIVDVHRTMLVVLMLVQLVFATLLCLFGDYRVAKVVLVSVLLPGSVFLFTVYGVANEAD